jgi:hypothetical protein
MLGLDPERWCHKGAANFPVALSLLFPFTPAGFVSTVLEGQLRPIRMLSGKQVSGAELHDPAPSILRLNFPLNLLFILLLELACPLLS